MRTTPTTPPRARTKKVTARRPTRKAAPSVAGGSARQPRRASSSGPARRGRTSRSATSKAPGQAPTRTARERHGAQPATRAGRSPRAARIDPRATWRWHDKIACRTIGEEAVIVGIETDEVHLLNDVGTFIWGQLEAGCSLDGLVQRLTEAYEVDAGRARADATTFLSQLAAKRLIVNPRGVRSAR